MVAAIIGLSVCINILLGLLLKRFVTRTIQYDSLFNIVNEDIEINLEYLNDMLSNHISTNAPEIVELDRNLKIMRDRFTAVTSSINELHTTEEEDKD